MICGPGTAIRFRKTRKAVAKGKSAKPAKIVTMLIEVEMGRRMPSIFEGKYRDKIVDAANANTIPERNIVIKASEILLVLSVIARLSS